MVLDALVMVMAGGEDLGGLGTGMEALRDRIGGRET
jgi:hypothetical protein